ncbi:MAG: NADH-quinone oxidoreductase subunit J [Bacillota bacterium]
MNGAQLGYIILAAVTLISAYGVVVAPKLMHSALWLGAAFVGMAGLFLLLDADFLAAAQILIYVGAITTMILFGIMLSDIRDLRAPGVEPWWKRLASLVLSPRRGLLPLLSALGFTSALWAVAWRAPWPDQAPPASENVTASIGELLFTQYALPFEVASVLLLVALVGAVVLSMREGAKER